MTKKLIQLTKEAEEKLSALSAIFSLLPLPGEPAKNQTPTYLQNLVRAAEITTGLAVADGAWRSLGTTEKDTETVYRTGETGSMDAAQAKRQNRAAYTSPYGQMRALRRMSELMLRT